MAKERSWRQSKELLLGITYPEDKGKRWAIKQAIERKEEEMRKEQEHLEKVGTCPKCHIMKTTEGECSMRCS